MRYIDVKPQRAKVYAQLRGSYDGTDPFVTSGHAVRGGGRTTHLRRILNTPAWVNDDDEVRTLLLGVFPKLETNRTQRERAGTWMTVIHLFFRLGYTSLHVAMVKRWSLSKVHTTVRNIRRAAAGNEVGGGGRADGNAGKRGRRPRGRPFKTNSTQSPAPFGS